MKDLLSFRMNQSEQHLTFLANCKLAEVSFKILNEFPKKEYKRHRIAVLLITCMLLPSTILLNGISIITIRKSFQLKNKVCYFVILIQSVVDLGVGVVGIPLFLCYLIFPFLDSKDCSFIILVIRAMQLIIGLSVVTLSAMTMERYVGVLHPYSYKTEVTKKRILVYVCAFGLFIFCVASYSLRDRKIIGYVYRGMAFVFFVFTGFAYTRIYLVLRKLQSSDFKTRPAFENKKEYSIRKKIIRESRHVRGCFLVVVCFALFVIPSTVLPALFKKGTPEYLMLFDWSHVLLILNSTTNSVVYFWSKTMLRKEALKILKQCYS